MTTSTKLLEAPNKLLLAFALLLALAPITFAQSTASFETKQEFDENQFSENLRDLTLFQDSEAPLFQAGEIRVRIPDSLEVIFDEELTQDNFVLLGSAVDNGRVEARPEITFEDRDKTLFFNLDQDLADAEELIIRNMYIEGFHEHTRESARLELLLGEERVSMFVTGFIDIEINTDRTDRTAPKVVTNVQFEETEQGLKVTWEDPTDLDLLEVQFLRGTDSQPLTGTIYEKVGAGRQEFIDTEVLPGETVTYIISAYDGVNLSERVEVMYTMGSVSEEPVEELPEEEPVEEEAIEEIQEETEEIEEVQDEVETIEEPQREEVSFTDLTGHWSEDFVIPMVEAGIVRGDAAGTFRPDDSLNRAEAAALLHRTLGLSEPETPLEGPFSDILTTEWFAGYVHDLKVLGHVEGNPDGTYRPNEAMNRAEFLTLAMRVYWGENEALTLDLSAPSFEDVLVGSWYEEVAAEAKERGFVEGRICESGQGSCFVPAGQITRAEATTILYRMFGQN